VYTDGELTGFKNKDELCTISGESRNLERGGSATGAQSALV